MQDTNTIFVKRTLTRSLTDEDALHVDGLDEVTEQRSLVSKHLPLSQLVRGGHAHHLGGGMIKGRRQDREHLEGKHTNSVGNTVGLGAGNGCDVAGKYLPLH